MRKLFKIDPNLHIEKITDVIKEPKIIRVNEFDEKALESFEEDMDEAINSGQPVVPIMIDSYGGSAYGVLGFIAAIETCPIPVATIVTTKAMSAGAILFCFGTENYRFVHPNAQIMIHDLGSFAAGKIEDIKSDSAHLDALNKAMYKRVSKQIGKSEDYLPNLIKQHSHVDWYLTAQEAKKHNIANHLRMPKFEIEINLKISFK